MALFGSVGKFFSSGAGSLLVPIVPITSAAVQLASGNPKGATQTIQGSVGAYRTVIAAVASGARNPRVDNPIPQQQYTPAQSYQPEQYFQPVQYSSGSYDPNLGGGYPSWDYSIGSAQTQETPYWGTYSEATGEDWAANW
jgi:hypothetical protein